MRRPIEQAGDRAGQSEVHAPRSGALIASIIVAASLLSWSSARADEGAPDARDALILLGCGEGDATLASVAGELARRKLAGQHAPQADELSTMLLEAGATYPWPRTVIFAGDQLDRGAIAARVRAWRAALPGGEPRRCGVGSAIDEQSHEAIAVVSAPALAVMSKPLPTQVRPGTWLTLDAQLRVEASSARLLVMGPQGAPQAVPLTLTDGRAFGRFSVDRPGAWRVQLLADRGEGPVPVLDAAVHAGEGAAAVVTTPGEDERGPSPEASLLAMLNAARKDEGLSPLTRDPALDAIARAHVRRMATQGALAHDAGGGDPEQRLDAAGLDARDVGENVAHARSVVAVHRALWSSPSHRQNLVSSRYQRVGVGMVRDKDGSLWAAQLFIGR